MDYLNREYHKYMKKIVTFGVYDADPNFDQKRF